MNTLKEQIEYNKGRGWRVDNLERVYSEFMQVVEEKREAEDLLYKACLFLAKLDRHPSHLFWIKALDAETLERELGPDFDIQHFKNQFHYWKRLTE